MKMCVRIVIVCIVHQRQMLYCRRSKPLIAACILFESFARGFDRLTFKSLQKCQNPSRQLEMSSIAIRGFDLQTLQRLIAVDILFNPFEQLRHFFRCEFAVFHAFAKLRQHRRHLAEFKLLILDLFLDLVFQVVQR